jgi:hypothetical protein
MENYEVDYVVNPLKRQLPHETSADIKDALFDVAKKVPPSGGREKIMCLARKELNS